jgi:uncharacterized membrane protein YdjX (TVP38/TMEM64 family)
LSGRAAAGKGDPTGLSRAAAGVRLAGLGAALAGCVAVLLLSGSLSAGRVRGWVDGYGAAGPLVFIVVSACLTVVLFPGPVLAAASGLLFGTALGTPVSIASATLGATLAFCVARWWGHDAVVALAGPRLTALRAWVGRRGFLTVLYARIAPGVPYTLVNYAAGLTPIALRSFVAATAIGVAPRAFAYTALGGSLGDLTSPEALVALGVLVAMGVTGLALARRDLRAGRRAPPGAESADLDRVVAQREHERP